MFNRRAFLAFLSLPVVAQATRMAQRAMRRLRPPDWVVSVDIASTCDLDVRICDAGMREIYRAILPGPQRGVINIPIRGVRRPEFWSISANSLTREPFKIYGLQLDAIAQAPNTPA